MMKINISAKTDIGLERTNNEDAFLFCPILNQQDWGETTNKYINNGSYGTLAVVADGMGGANAGETASAIALEAIKNSFNLNSLDALNISDYDILSFLKATIQDANDAILKRIEIDPDTIGMGTTLVLLWVIQERAYIAWCGDSRCYVFNPQKGLRCLSKDHSLVQELIDNGELSINESYNHPKSNVITRFLGDSDTYTLPEILMYDVHPNDTFLLCSDGLSGCSKDNAIEKILYSNISDIDLCNQLLIDFSLKAGGCDNVTTILLSVVEDNCDKVEVPCWIKWKKTLGL